MEEMRSAVICRVMRKEDAQAAARLEASCSREPWAKESYLDALENENALYAAAWLDGKMIGCCGFWQSFEEADICNVAVAHKWRRRGVAGKMLCFLMKLAEDRGVCAFTLEVRRSNTAAICLYEKLGFAPEGVRRNFYENPKEDALIMWKR